MHSIRVLISVVLTGILLTSGCARLQERMAPRDTARDKTKRGAIIGAATGAVLGAVIGEGEADEILASAAIGAGIGAGVGGYMDRQEERIARIPGTSVERISEDVLLVHFEADLLFDVDRFDLNSQSRANLDRAAEVFAEYPKTAIVAQGHTDSTGSDSYNQTLSERRARAVINYLSDSGVDSSRMAAQGYGETHPIADNGTISGRRANRRVDLLLKAKVK